MKNIQISIIIPLFNSQSFIKESITSILRQSFTDFEILVIDDGSTDFSGKICDLMASEDDRIIVVHKQNGGPQSACIEGIKHAVGKYISFVDSDDLIEKTYLQCMFDAAETSSADIVISPSYNYSKDRKELRASYFSSGIYDEDRIKNELFPRLINTGGFLTRGIQSTRWGKLFRKDLLVNNLQYYDSSLYYGEDLNMIFPAFLDCKVIVIEDNNAGAYYYRNNPNSIVNSYKKNLCEQNHSLHEKMLRCSKDKNVFDFERQILADHLAVSTYCYSNEIQRGRHWESIVHTLDKIAKDPLFRRAVREIDYSKYPYLRKAFINILARWNWVDRNIISKLLYRHAQLRKIKNGKKANY